MFVKSCELGSTQGFSDDDFIDNDHDSLTYSGLKQDLKIRGLKIFHQNVNGLSSKIELIRIMRKEMVKGIKIVGITETHLTNTIKDKKIKIDGCEIARNDRKQRFGGGGGGLCIYKE